MKHQKPFIILFLLLAIGVVLYQNLSYPENELQKSFPQEFLSANAYNHLKVIAQQPRRMYQPYYYETRNYIINELKKLGVETEIQQSTSLEPYTPIFYSSVENIIAKRKGTSGKGDAILLVAHFDSEPFVSPGAFDNAASVALLLELARVVKSSKGLENDLVILFSVPEEPGLQGVMAFINEHPLAKKVKMVFNFDGIVNGRFGILNTSGKNSGLIKEYAKACPSSQAYSIVNSLNSYPTGDISAFKYAGYPGISFMSYFNEFRQHHSKNDDLSKISLSSIQECGNNMLALVNHFGNININKRDTEASIYFSVLNLFIISYPANLVIPFSFIVSLLFIIVIMYSSKKGVINFKKILYTIFLIILGCIVATGSVKLIWYLITEFHPMYQFLFNNYAYNNLYFFLSFIILSFISIYVVLFIGCRKIKFNSYDLDYGVLVLLTITNLIVSFIFPDIAAILTWVILFLQVFIISRLVIKDVPLIKMIITAGYVSVAVILIIPIIMTSYMTTDDDPLRYLSMVLFSIILLPVLYDIILEYKKIVFSAFGLAFFVLLFIPLTDHFNVKSPRVTYVSCIYDADRKQSFWLTDNLYKTGLDKYSAQFVREDGEPESVRKYIPDYPYDYDAYFTPIGIDSFPAPQLEVVKDSTSNDYRYLDLKIKSLRDAWEITILKDPELNVIEYALDGVKCEAQFGLSYINSDKNILCFYRNPRKDGITLSLKVRAGEKVTFKIRDRTYGIPLKPGMKPMTDVMIPWVDYGANTTSVIKTFTL